MAAIEHQPTHSRAAVDTATATLKAHAPAVCYCIIAVRIFDGR
jgi:hypothetical protein